MDDAGLMRGGQAPGRLTDCGRGGRGRQTLASVQHVLQRSAGHVLHHDEVVIRLLTDVEDCDHVGVLQLGGGAGLAEELLEALAICLDLPSGKDLGRHLSAQHDVLGPVDRAGLAPAQHGRQPVAAQFAADQIV